MKKKFICLFLLLSCLITLPFFNSPVKAVTWDLLEQDWDSVDGWTFYGTGTSEIDPAGQLHQVSSGSNPIGRYKDIGSFPETGYTVEFRMNISSWPTEGAQPRGAHYKTFYDGQHYVVFSIFADKIRWATEGGYGEQSINTTAGVFYVWRLVIDSDADIGSVYRDGIFIRNFTDPFYDYTPGEGMTYHVIDARDGGSGEHHEDYYYVATGLYHPIAEHTLTFYYNIGGTFRVDNETITNGSEKVYYIGTILELSALPQNSSYVLSSFDWNDNNATTNPYNLTVTSNLTVWCYFDFPPAAERGEYIAVGIAVSLIFIPLLILIVWAIRRRRS